MFRFLPCILVTAAAFASLEGKAHAETFPAFPQVVKQWRVGLCFQDDVRRELNLSDKDIVEIDKALRPLAAKYNTEVQKLSSKGAEAAREEHQKIVAVVSAEALEAVTKLLKPQQASRLKQIDWQLQGPAAFDDPEVQKALGFSANQKNELVKARDDFDRKLTRLKRIASGVETPNPGDELASMSPLLLRRIYSQNVNNVLTANQREKWSGMIGPAFPSKSKPKPK